MTTMTREVGLHDHSSKFAIEKTILCVDPNTLASGTTHPAHVMEPSSTFYPFVMPSRSSAPSTSTTPPPTSRPPLNQALIYQMGNLAHSTDVRASRLENKVLDMIAAVIEASIYPVQRIDGPTGVAEKLVGDESEQVEDEEESIVHATLERSGRETFAICSSGVYSLDSTIPPPDVSGTNARDDVTLLPPTLDVPGIDARDDSTLSKIQD
uniref:Polyprotein protein n=1 Tax=Solanum tuberosum TaxID=4113 RepID=M1DY13_SOLTU